jgi:hypothetical protein
MRAIPSIVMVELVPAIHALSEAERRGCAGPHTSLRSLRKLDCVPAHDGDARELGVNRLIQA